MREKSEILSMYRRECERRAHRPGSIDKRLSLLARTEASLGHDLLTATTEELRGFLDKRRLNSRTIYSYISHWASFWKWAVIEGHVQADPTLRLTRPKLRVGLPRPVATKDLKHLIENAPSPAVAAMIYLAGHAGLRCMEIANIEGPDIMENADPPLLVIAHGKGDKPRVVPMSAQLIEALKAHGIPKYGPVFKKPNGQPYQPWGISHILRGHLHDCGIDASAHQLRHAFATEVYRRSGGDLRMTQELLGHASPSTTAIYTAWAQDKAAAVMKDMYGPAA